MASQLTDEARAERPAPARVRQGGDAPSAPTFNADFLLEMTVCEAHSCAMQVATIAIMLSACTRPGAKYDIRSCRHLLHGDVNIMLLALRYGGQIGLSADDVARLSDLYRGIAEAQKNLSPLAETAVLSQSQRSLLKSQSAGWRRLAAEASAAISRIEVSARGRLNGIYSDDAKIVRQYLARAADGETSDVDNFGVVHPPELKQRRSRPRVAVQKDCELILSTGSYPAELEDVSSNGLSVRCQHPLAKGQKVVVALEDGRKLDAVVVRCQGGKVGMSLSRTLPATDPLFRTDALRKG